MYCNQSLADKERVSATEIVDELTVCKQKLMEIKKKARGDTDAAWSRTGVTDLQHLSSKSNKHEVSRVHKTCEMHLGMLARVHIAVQLIIECIKFYGAFELALQCHDETSSSNPGLFLGLADFVSKIDQAMEKHLTMATVFKGTQTGYVATQVDETSDFTNISQSVLVFRYIIHQCERGPNTIEDCDTSALKIFGIIISHAKERFAFRKHLVDAKLLQSDRFDEYQLAFSDSVLEETVQAYPMLGKTSLFIDLQTMYETKDFKSAENKLSMLELMIYNNLDKTFPEITKLLKIVIATPVTTAEAERCFSTLKRIKPFLRNSMKTERLNALAMLSIEKATMTDIPDFNNKAIEKKQIY
ncbi:ZMYM1 protein, partial [Polyodon spathula]|nr:ZMYM1 protein [Polyodon spathula]